MERSVNFSRIGQWALVSDCGRYTVTCIRTANGYKFEAWHRGPPETNLGIFSDAEAARQRCREHAAGKAVA